MKLVSFSRLGKARFGAVVKDGVIDLTGKLDPDVNTIKELISLQIEDQGSAQANGFYRVIGKRQ